MNSRYNGNDSSSRYQNGSGGSSYNYADGSSRYAAGANSSSSGGGGGSNYPSQYNQGGSSGGSYGGGAGGQSRYQGGSSQAAAYGNSRYQGDASAGSRSSSVGYIHNNNQGYNHGQGGYNNNPYNNQNDGYGELPPQERSWQNVDEEEENYNDEGWLQRKTKKVQDDSVNTTRQALSKLREAEDSASAGLTRLNQQSEQLYKVENKLNEAEGHAKMSEAKVKELKGLNRFFMLPTFGASKRTKAVEERTKREMAEAEAAEHERRANIEQVLEGGRGSFGSQGNISNGRSVGYDSSSSLKSYSTPDGLFRDEKEVEIDNNLDELSAGLARLKTMGLTMNQEIETQNSHIRRIGDKSEDVRARVDKSNRDVQRMVGGGRRK